MRKVNLRNVDPAIDDPDASTWCMYFTPFLIFYNLTSSLAHPTLNRHSPPEVVANFKRRVPPRLPKPRKRDVQDLPSIPPPRSAMGIGHIPLTVPSSVANHNKLVNSGRARGFSLPSTMAPLNQLNSNGWSSNNYNRSALPPLMVPSDPPHLSQSNGIYSPHPLDDPSSSNFHSINSYSSSTRDLVVPSSQYSNSSDQNNWSSFNNGYNPSPSHNGSNLSSLLNPPVHNSYSRPNTSINTSSYTSPFSSMPLTNEHSGSSLSPESRPTTGYSMSSVSSLPYQDDYSRPSSSTHHHRPISPPRPPSSKSTYGPGSLSVRRARRHSQAMSPYPNPYDPNEHQQQQQQRPSTSPTPIEDHQSQTHPDDIPRVRSMIQLPSVDPYAFSNHDGGAEFAYSALPTTNHHHHHQVGHSASTLDSINDAGGWPGTRNIQVRPSTATSSISAASHTTSSSSQANTPPIQENFDGETDINRCKSLFLFFLGIVSRDGFEELGG